MLFSFTEELSCVFISTGAMMMMQSGNINTVGRSVVEMLVRELEYEYVATRHHFITGVLALIIAQALRARQALRFQPALARSAMFGVIATAASLLTYSNARTITYGGYVGMAWRFCVLHSRLILSSANLRYPMAICGLVASILSVGFAWQAFREPMHQSVNSQILWPSMLIGRAKRPLSGNASTPLG